MASLAACGAHKRINAAIQAPFVTGAEPSKVSETASASRLNNVTSMERRTGSDLSLNRWFTTTRDRTRRASIGGRRVPDGRILDPELLQIRVVPGGIVVVLLHLIAILRHGIRVQPDGRLIVGTHEALVLFVLG